MRRQLAGPGTNKHDPKKDIGKQAPAATNTGAYRPTNIATGPQSAQVEWTATKDAGVNLPCSGGGGRDFFDSNK
jgi:hypothetical protein